MRLVRIMLVVVAASLACAAPARPAALEQKIAFSSNRDGDYDIYVMNPDGSNLVQLTNDPGDRLRPLDLTRRHAYRVHTRPRRPLPEHVVAQDAGLDPDWSPDGKQLVFGTLGHGAPDGLWVINADGTNRRMIALVDRSDVEPSWAPDNSLIAFTVNLNFDDQKDGIYTVAPDGTGLRQITFTSPDLAVPANPDFRPDSAKIAFDGISVMNPDGSGAQPAGAPGVDPSWSPDATQFAYVRSFVTSSQQFYSEIYRVNVDGTGELPLTNDMAKAIDPVWGRLSELTGPGYPRPKGASPMRISLVPANQQCISPNSTHGAPLASGSCSPVQLSSQHLTTGTPDANGRSARMNAYLLLNVVPGDPATAADEADVQVTAHVNDVANKDLSDYAGELRANLPVRITDRDNLPPVGGPGPGTTQPFPFGFDVPCTANSAPNVGSDCSLSTTIDALVPGAIKETRRAIWQLGIVRVFDGGADGNGSTTGDNTVFATQGIFIP